MSYSYYPRQTSYAYPDASYAYPVPPLQSSRYIAAHTLHQRRLPPPFYPQGPQVHLRHTSPYSEIYSPYPNFDQSERVLATFEAPAVADSVSQSKFLPQTYLRGQQVQSPSPQPAYPVQSSNCIPADSSKRSGSGVRRERTSVTETKEGRRHYYPLPRRPQLTASFNTFDENEWRKEDAQREALLQLSHRTHMENGLADPLPKEFADYFTIRLDLSYLTVEKLKQTIRLINSRLYLGIRLSGNKVDLVERVRNELEFAKNKRDIATYRKLRECMQDASGSTGAPWKDSSKGAPRRPDIAGLAALRPDASLPKPLLTYASGSAFVEDGTTPASAIPSLPITFRLSPFFRPEAAVMTRADLSISPQGDRKTAWGSIVLTSEQRQKLLDAQTSQGNAQYQVRLYCCTESYFNPLPYFNHNHNRGAVATQNRGPAPVEFPAACEVKVNSLSIGSSKLRGVKKKEGSAAPPDLGPYLDLGINRSNRVEVVYVNTDRRYYAIAYLVEATPVSKLLQKIKKGRYRSKDDVVAAIRNVAEDEEISATSSELSLKDPLTFARMNTPVRSIHCSHLQCFDGESYLQMMEQTPTWDCPVCNNPIRFEELAVDGFTEEIINNCPSADSVIIDALGNWKVAEEKARSSSTANNDSAGDDLSDDADVVVTKAASHPPYNLNIDQASAAINLDNPSPARSPLPSHLTRASVQPPVVIDLTLSDDDVSAAIPRPNSVLKTQTQLASDLLPAQQQLKRTASDAFEGDARGAPRHRPW